MPTFNEEKTKIRRYLRDPDENIWSNLDVLTYWNDAQQEIFGKTGYIERAHNYKYPPEWTYSYMRDWEREFTEGDKYQCLQIWQARNETICYPWEPLYFLTNSTTADDGARFVHPWESEFMTPADYVPCPLHEDFHNMKFAAYDEQPLFPIDRKKLAETDRWYKTTSGLPEAYWRPDVVSNQFVMYKRPSNATSDDDNVLGSPLDSFDDDGGIVTWSEADLDETDAGLIYDKISTDNQVFMIFEQMPTDIGEDQRDWDDQLNIPAFFAKYVRYAALERCYGADTDGFIPSLRDYWQLRKEIGLKAIKKFKALRKTDRDYQFAGTSRRNIRPSLKLPPEYPQTYP
ncbi:hypothetical protein CMI37_15460 [Candidatus Pacearchaeota archaeon]|nr:hypothetical protein [Candidatus Pacearchaeota archaeon]